ncbi:unnamed protein product [Prunus armeniaca]|uniref:Multidrug resistance-associated protein 9 n=1 Tax=Prunus armeniaca TaxID=36596 RepID=A0A6J5WGE5_PRUAR|nr:unnamed protein product [Prunus armeniaca]
MSNMAGSSTSELRTPIFNGENYEFWSIRMKTILKSHGLWVLVENGLSDLDLKKEKEEAVDTEKSMVVQTLMKDARALGLIQSAVSDQLFPRIVNEETSKGAWDILKLEFRGDKQAFTSLNVGRKNLDPSLNVGRKNLENGIASADQISQKNWKSNDGNKMACKHCDRFHYGKCWYEGKPKCHGCGKPGHMIRDCYGHKNVQRVNYANQEEDCGTLFYVCNAATDVKVNHSWYIDSGCSNHMTGDEGLLVNIQRNLSSKVKMGTGEVVPVAGKGILVIKTKLGKKHIHEVMLVPGLEENLLSVGQMMEHGYHLVFGGNEVSVYDNQSLENLIVKVQMTNNRCFPLTMMPASELVLKASVTHCLQTWHKRLGHLNERSIKLLENQGMVHGLPHLEQKSVVCDGCMLGKQHRDSFPLESTWRASNPLELVHTDICGPMKTESLSGNRYFLLFTDDFTRMSWVYFIRNKSSALECFRKFKAMTELQSGYKIKGLRSDRGGEFLSGEFNKFCEESGIQRQLTMAYSPQQNGVAERKNRTVVEMAKSMLHEKGVPYEFWAEAVNTAVYLLNRCPTKALNKITPFEAYTGRKPGIAHLKIFGSPCHVLIPSALRHKFEENSHKCIFVGYGLCEKGYRLFDPNTRKIILSRDVQFDENGLWKWENTNEEEMVVPLPTENQSCEPSQSLDTSLQMNEEVTLRAEPSQSLDTQTQIVEDTTLQDEGIGESSHFFDHTPKKWRSVSEIMAKCNVCIVEPENYEDAAQDESWRKAMEVELEMIEKNDTWELVERPFAKPVIGVKWVYKTKLNLDGTVQKNKARLVAKGYSQKPDVKSAFLNGVLKEEVYVEQPQGFVKKDEETKVYKLHKALYGLKQAPRAWYDEIDAYFNKADFKKSPSEATLYVKAEGSDVLIVSLYVDDIVYTGSSSQMIEEFRRDMMEHYEMTDLGVLHHFLGMGVIQSKQRIFLHQKKYGQKLVEKFGLKDCKIVATPLAMNEKLSKNDGSEAADEGEYRQIVGSLLYLTATRPDIMFAASLLARFMHNPTKKHMGTAKRVLRYIQGTIDFGIVFEKGKETTLIGYCDSDWAGSEDDMRSTSGYVFTMGSGVFSWASIKQNTVALSTAEAEYISAAEATSQAKWLRFVLEDFGEEQIEGTQIMCDNTSAIAMAKNPVFHQKSRHINRKFHFIREAIQAKEIELVYCRTEEQIADILTKALPKDRFAYLRELLGVKSAKGLEGNVGV